MKTYLAYKDANATIKDLRDDVQIISREKKKRKIEMEIEDSILAARNDTKKTCLELEKVPIENWGLRNKEELLKIKDKSNRGKKVK